MNTETIEIEKVECLIEKNGYSDVISSITGKYKLEAETGEISEIGFQVNLDTDNIESFINFEDFVENDARVLGWVNSKLSQAIKDRVLEDLNEKITPTKIIKTLG